MIHKLKRDNSGSMLVMMLLLTALFMVISMGAISLALLELRMNKTLIASNQALHIAEAGVNYYRWVLYHDHDEYCNKETCLAGPDHGPYGPYVYSDASGLIAGYYELYITPPPTNGSTIVKIRSVGWVAGATSTKREIEVQCGIPSWANYSTLANDVMRFGVGTEVWGPIHSNNGIRFDGLAHNIVSSGILEYTDPDHSDPEEFAVHTHVGVGLGTHDPNELSPGTNPPNPPNRSDVFMAGRSFPTAVVSFDMLDTYVNTSYILATTSGLVFDPRPAGIADPASVAAFRGCASAGGSCDEGFHIILRNDDTFDIKGVSAVEPVCHNPGTDPDSPSMSIRTEQALATNYPIPANGIIFVKNNVWVDGIINNSRVSIFAFKEPFAGANTDITVNRDLKYTNYDGTDAIGLIAQNNINAGLYSEGSLSGADDGELRIDAALIAKNGRIGRYFYQTSCSNEFHKRNKITIFGSLSTKVRYGFSFGCGNSNEWCSGYDERDLVYDNNLTFSPPPHFPTTGEYTFISWDEK